MSEPNGTADMSDPAQVIVCRVMRALCAEFDNDDVAPHVVIVAECPSDGRIGYAATGDDLTDVHRILCAGVGAIRLAMPRIDRIVARQFHESLEREWFDT